MQKTLKYITATLFALAAIISLWFLLNNLQPLSPGLYSFAVIAVFTLIILFMLFGGKLRNKTAVFLSKVFSIKYFAVIALSAVILISVLIRLYFYRHFSFTPISDPITFFDAAQKIASGGNLHGDSYTAFLPFLAAYENLLGFAMKLIHNSWLAIITLNTVFDIAAAFAIYFTVKMIAKPHSKLPIVAFAVWLLSPFNILFSLVSLPIIVVNFFIAATVLLLLLLIKVAREKKVIRSLLIAILIGVTIGLGNAFRPVFVVMLVALFLVLCYIFMSSKNRTKLPLLLSSIFVIIVAVFLGAQQLNLAIVAKQTGIQPAQNSTGWNIFVGANSATDGKWSHEDEVRLNQICNGTRNYEECHKKLRDAALERYKGYGITGTANLLVRKLYIFSSNQSNVYNPNLSIDNYAHSTAQKLFNVYLTLFLIGLFFLSFWFFYQTARETLTNNAASPALLFIALSIVGLFLSAMLVEVSERYAQTMYPLFIIAAVLGLGVWKNKPSKKVSKNAKIDA